MFPSMFLSSYSHVTVANFEVSPKTLVDTLCSQYVITYKVQLMKIKTEKIKAWVCLSFFQNSTLQLAGTPNYGTLINKPMKYTSTTHENKY